MAYDAQLADRIREHLASVTRVTEREMFGGITFMIAGNMCCGVLGDDVIVRIDPTLHHDALTRPNVSEFTMGGRTSKGMIRVGPAGVADEDELALWVRLGIAHATSLPAKKAGAKKAAPARKTVKKTKTAPAKKSVKKTKTAPARKTAKKKKVAPARKAVKKKVAPAKKKTPVRKKAAAKKRAGRARR